MKRILIGLALVAGILTAQAATHRSQSFLNSSILSLGVTNTIGITNLYGSAYGTNLANVVYTNAAGTRTATAANADYTVFVTEVELPPSSGLPYANNAATMPTNTVLGSLFIRLKGGSGANSAVTFIFAPVMSNSGVASTDTTLAVAVTATTTTEKMATTPLYNTWPGAKKLRLISITNADTDASSNVDVLECSFASFY